MHSFQLSYDYRCPFAKNIHLHVISALRAGAKYDVRFVPWTMSQSYKVSDAPDVWDDPAHDDDLFALAVSTSVRDFQSQRFLDVHEALFRARHERAIRLVSERDIRDALVDVELDLESVFSDVASRRPHGVIGESFLAFERYEAFGVPTFVVDEDATFIRYMDPPSSDGEASIRLIDSLLELMKNQSSLNEFKHTTVPF